MTVTTYLDFIAAFHIAWEAHDLKIKTQTGFASQSNGIVFQLNLIPISERTAGAEKKPPLLSDTMEMPSCFPFTLTDYVCIGVQGFPCAFCSLLVNKGKDRSSSQREDREILELLAHFRGYERVEYPFCPHLVLSLFPYL